MSSSRLYGFVRQFNFLSMTTPPIMQQGQKAVRLIGVPEVAAVARWGVAGGFLFYWMIEHHFEEKPQEQ